MEIRFEAKEIFSKAHGLEKGLPGKSSITSNYFEISI